MLDNSRDVIYRLNIQTGRFEYISPAAEAVIGFSPDELMALDSEAALAMIHPDDMSAMRAALARLEETGREKVEYRQRAKSGDYRWISNHILLIRDGAGRPLYRDGNIRDITERKQFEETLAASETKYRTVIQNMGWGFALYEMLYDGERKPIDWWVIEVNDAYERHTGVARKRVEGRLVSEIIPEAMSDYMPFFAQTIADKTPVEFEIYSKLSARYLHVIAFPAGNARFGAVFMDIGERKRVEAALKAQARQLEDANKELESFSYSVSHDLRAPLRAIDGYSRMILKKQGEQLDEETRQRLQMIKGNTEKMGRLIDDLLALSRFGSQAVTKKDLNMEELVSEVWSELLAMHPDRKMTLKNGPMPMAWGDRSLIWQVYSNLLDNAAKFTHGREGALIETGSFVQNGEMIYYVRDNGVGFDMQYHDKLFGAFQRLHSEEEYKGTGIGLALVKRIIERHGGRVWAEGEVDKGATFYFALPTQQR